MDIRVDAGWLLAVLLASMRLAALLVMVPVLGGAGTPPRARVLLGLALTATLLAALPLHVSAPDLRPASLAVAALRELAIGAVMAFGLHTAFGALGLAGRLLDMQIGFTVGSIFDPVTRAASPVLGTLLTMLGAAVFYAMDGHLMLVRAVAFSFEQLPPGGPFRWWDAAPVVAQFGTMFVLGLTLAAPVVIALLLVDVGLGIVSRTMPQMNVFLVSIVVKIFIGLLVLMATLPAAAPVLRRLFDTTFRWWQQMLG
ncbi:MAG: flagellar biosynthetic protein FliR [Aquabacterium sp.]|nr:MAG: flagellar biosynthetic protein FliR [Aquabacterium sp.]